MKITISVGIQIYVRARIDGAFVYQWFLPFAICCHKGGSVAPADLCTHLIMKSRAGQP